MPKKNKKTSKIDSEQINDTSLANDALNESAAVEQEPVVLESNTDPRTEPGIEPSTEQAEIAPVDLQTASAEGSQEETSDPSQPEDESVDDLLEDVRRSLIEDETHTEEEKQSKWWNRISKAGKSSKGGKGSRKAKADKADVVKDEPVNKVPAEMIEAARESQKTDPEPDPIDELIEILEHEAEHDAEKVKPAAVVKADRVEEVAPEPEQIVDVEELKKHAFSHREAEPTEDLSEVRAIALGGDEQVFVEVEATRQDPGQERLKAFENALRPYRTYIYLVMAFLGIVMAGLASILLFNVYKASLPAKPAEEVSNLPFPTAVSLPGGWSFNLAKGSLVDGQWNPRGAEWLQGTEVCRWVALPWTRQLEAVVRTLNPKDPIELVMSNQDKLVYEVYSLHQMSPEEMQELDSNSPCLLIVLAEPDAEKRWVLTAVP